MGQLYYGALAEPIDMPDQLLAHFRAVASTKLRRGESFTVSWPHAPDEVPGRTTLWIQPSIPLRFIFESPDPEQLDPARLQRMARDASATGGLNFTADDMTGTGDLRCGPA